MELHPFDFSFKIRCLCRFLADSVVQVSQLATVAIVKGMVMTQNSHISYAVRRPVFAFSWKIGIARNDWKILYQHKLYTITASTYSNERRR